MKMAKHFSAATTLLLLGACATASAPASPAHSASTNLEPCLLKAMEFMEGTWDYIGITARIGGTYTTYETRSIHARFDDRTWTAQSFGGDAGDDESVSYERLRGNKVFAVEDGEEMIDNAHIYLTCKGPNEVGRIETTSTYSLPLDEEATEFVHIDNFAAFSESGSYFSDSIKNEAGDVVAYRSGITVPASTDG